MQSETDWQNFLSHFSMFRNKICHRYINRLIDTQPKPVEEASKASWTYLLVMTHIFCRLLYSEDIIRLGYRLTDFEGARTSRIHLCQNISLSNSTGAWFCRMLIIVITWRDRVCHKEIWLSFICGTPHLAKLPRLTLRQILEVGDFYLVDVGTFMRHWILMMWIPWHHHRLVTSGSNLEKHFSIWNFKISNILQNYLEFKAKRRFFRMFLSKENYLTFRNNEKCKNKSSNNFLKF